MNKLTAPRPRSLSRLRAATALGLLVGCSVALAGCQAGTAGENTGTNEAALRRMQSCGELGDAMKASARKKLNRAVDAQIDAIRKYGVNPYYGGYDGRGVPEAAQADGAPTSAGSPNPSAPSGSSTSSSGSAGAESGSSKSSSSDRASSSTQTNNQVEGVAEADDIQTDGGKYIYVLHGNTLQIVDAWPATSMRIAASTPIEGSPSEVLTADGQAVVFSTVNGTPIFKAAGVQPNDAEPNPWYATDSAIGSGGSSAETKPGYPGGGSTPPPDPYRPITKATVLRFDGTTISVAGEYYFEGQYVSSRRVDGLVRGVLQGWEDPLEPLTWPYVESTYDTKTNRPKTVTEAIYDLELARAKGLAAIAKMDVVKKLPRRFLKNGSVVTVESETCSDFFVPEGVSASGITTVVGFEMKGSRPRATSIVAQAQNVYSSRTALYVAASAWERDEVWASSWGVGFSGGDTVSSPGSSGGSSPPPSDPGVAPTPVPDAPPPKPASGNLRLAETRIVRPWADLNKTNVHKFAFSGTEPLYQGSGRVRGHILNQFSMDERDGYLRVATTAQRTNGYETKQTNHVLVFAQEGTALKQVGDVGALAEGERIYSARFLGAKAYVVTFRQVDPLFSIDLADPRNPRVTGQLKIPGFSTYIHPLDEDHLLTIGRDTDDGSGRVVRGALKLEIFDVSDAARPRSTHRWLDDGRYGSSEAENNHKAFTYFRERGLLAFPYAGSDSTGNYTTSLEIFRVHASVGIAPIGSIDHSPFFTTKPSCGYYYYDRGVRRGAFFADADKNFVYGISYGGIVSKSVTDLGGRGYSLAFPAPTFDNPYGSDTGAPSCAQPGGL